MREECLREVDAQAAEEEKAVHVLVCVPEKWVGEMDVQEGDPFDVLEKPIDEAALAEAVFK